jgi:GDP-4-dehydro-6-deoxy-D-mannose reductase
MKYLVTGITGFVGPHLAKLLLEKGHEVHGITRIEGKEQDLLDIMLSKELSSIKFHYLDLKDYYKVKKIIDSEKFDGIFHLAAQSHPPTSFINPILTWNENVMNTVNLITAIQGSKTRFMFCSSGAVYGESNDIGLLTIHSSLKPNNPYGASKAAMDLYVQERSINGLIDGFVVRAFSHTGPRRNKIYSISSDAYQIALMELGLQEKILKIGNLQTERIVMDVRDCVYAYYLLMINSHSISQVFNVCGNEIYKMQYFTDILIKYSKFDYDEIEQKIYEPYYKPITTQVQKGDTRELKELTKWEPTIPIEETMKTLLNYWRKIIKERIL